MVEIKCQNPFAPSPVWFLGFSLFLLNEALLRLRVNADAELNANKPTGNWFFKAVIKFLRLLFTYKKISLGYFEMPHAQWMCTAHMIFLLLLDLTFSGVTSITYTWQKNSWKRLTNKCCIMLRATHRKVMAPSLALISHSASPLIKRLWKHL